MFPILLHNHVVAQTLGNIIQTRVRNLPTLLLFCPQIERRFLHILWFEFPYFIQHQEDNDSTGPGRRRYLSSILEIISGNNSKRSTKVGSFSLWILWSFVYRFSPSRTLSWFYSFHSLSRRPVRFLIIEQICFPPSFHTFLIWGWSSSTNFLSKKSRDGVIL